MKESNLTFGEKLVGLDFNPSQNESVDKAKRLCAELADLIYESVPYDGERTPTQEVIVYSVFADILKTQMMAVKYLTNKH